MNSSDIRVVVILRCQTPRYRNFSHPKSNHRKYTHNTSTPISCASPNFYHKPPTSPKEELPLLEQKQRKEGRKLVDIRKASNMTSESMFLSAPSLCRRSRTHQLSPHESLAALREHRVLRSNKRPATMTDFPAPIPFFFQPAHS